MKRVTTRRSASSKSPRARKAKAVKRRKTSGKLKSDRVAAGRTLKAPAKKPSARRAAAPPDVAARARDAGATRNDVTIRGDANGDKRLIVAWTIDDGPRGAITEKMKRVGMDGIPQALWFVQYANIKARDWQNLRDIQSAGGEIGIHSFYPDDDHAAWFPTVKGGAYGRKHIRDAMPVRMAALKTFKTKLIEEGIFPKFVRVPGGLVSELINYAVQLRASETNARKIASAVIAGRDVGSAFTQIATDFALLKQALIDENLLLWGSGDLSVNPDPKAIGRLEWTAETSGARARTDNTTDVVDPSSKTKSEGLVGNKGQFEKLIATMKPRDVRGMVILAHDTTTQPGGGIGEDDVRAVKDDREHMETECKRRGIKLEYRTMSSLFTEVTRHDIATYRTAY